MSLYTEDSSGSAPADPNLWKTGLPYAKEDFSYDLMPGEATPLEGNEERLVAGGLTWVETVKDLGEVTQFQFGLSPSGRNFETGAYRDTDEGKYDYEGFLSPLVLERYAEYMNKHRLQSDGRMRDSDNWQAGIPKKEYMKSGWRHFFDWWKEHRGVQTQDSCEGVEDALCALIFNSMGYLHEVLKEKD